MKNVIYTLFTLVVIKIAAAFIPAITLYVVGALFVVAPAFLLIDLVRSTL